MRFENPIIQGAGIRYESKLSNIYAKFLYKYLAKRSQFLTRSSNKQVNSPTDGRQDVLPRLYKIPLICPCVKVRRALNYTEARMFWTLPHHAPVRQCKDPRASAVHKGCCQQALPCFRGQGSASNTMSCPQTCPLCQSPVVRDLRSWEKAIRNEEWNG